MMLSAFGSGVIVGFLCFALVMKYAPEKLGPSKPSMTCKNCKWFCIVGPSLSTADKFKGFCGHPSSATSLTDYHIEDMTCGRFELTDELATTEIREKAEKMMKKEVKGEIK